MKKIVAFIGSSMGEKSCTASFSKKIANKVKNKYELEIESEIITTDKVDIKACKGCCNCFRYCTCPLDKEDDMAVIKQKMIDADFIIWGSPVYAHQVSGQMKTFIDRISYWLHLLRLAGKPGIVLSSTASTGHMQVLSYLAKIMFHTGAKAVGGYSVFADFQGSFLDKKDVDRKTEKASEILFEYLSGLKVLTSNDHLESLFKNLKVSIRQSKKSKPGEYDYWEKEGYFECDTFGELLKKIKY